MPNPPVMGHLRNDNLLRTFEAVDQLVDSRFDTWCQWRRHLHAHPELSWHEIRTTSFIREQLAAMGLELTPGPRGCGGFVDFQGQPKAGRFLALRGDIDAIPVAEATGLEFCSTNPGVMHACGHDVHATTVLAVCDVFHSLFADSTSNPNVNLRAIFQPAEEVASGATEMMATGALEDVDVILAMHVDSTRQVGELGFRDGEQTACCDEISIKLLGPGGHGARPHEAADPIFAATQFINAAYALVPKVIDARTDVVLQFCEISGGHSANVIPTEVEIKGTLRCYGMVTRDAIFSRLNQLAESLGQAFGVQIQFKPGIHVPSVTNCPDTNKLLRAAADSFLSDSSITTVEPSLGGEDFACYQARIPGSLVRIGSARGDYGRAHLHSPHFDVDEDVIKVAVKLFVRSALLWFDDSDA